MASTELREPECVSAERTHGSKLQVIEGTEEDLSIKYSNKHPQASRSLSKVFLDWLTFHVLQLFMGMI